MITCKFTKVKSGTIPVFATIMKELPRYTTNYAATDCRVFIHPRIVA